MISYKKAQNISIAFSKNKILMRVDYSNNSRITYDIKKYHMEILKRLYS